MINTDRKYDRRLSGKLAPRERMIGSHHQCACSLSPIHLRAANSCDEDRHTPLVRVSGEPTRVHRQTAVMMDITKHHAASRTWSFVTAIPLQLRVRLR